MCVCVLRHPWFASWNTGAERAENLVSGIGAMRVLKIITRAGAGGRRAGNGVESRSHRSRFEWGVENLPLLISSHALDSHLASNIGIGLEELSLALATEV